MTGRLPQIAWERQGWLVAGPERPYDQPTWPVRRSADLRIGDAERDEAIADLGEHYAAGRLTREEFDERSDRALQARRHAELAPLFADLPVADTRPPVGPTLGRGPDPRWSLRWLAPLLLVAAVVTAVATSAPWVIWMVLTLFLFTAPWRRRTQVARRHPY